MDFPGFRLDDRVAIVTGSSKGIGFGMAQALANAGAHVVVVSRHQAECDAAAKEIAKLGGETLAVQCDVTNKKDVTRLVNATMDRFNRIDILVNNAGMNIRKLVADYEETEWDQVLSTNLKGIFLVAQAVAQVMMKQKSGKIINISSIFGGVAMTHQGAYASSKGAINQLTKVLALELAPYGVCVNALAPAYIRTPMTAGWLQDKERYQMILNSVPLGRIGELSDLAGPVVFLASDASNFVTGHVLYVDGGWLAK